ncbi:hypothetical protein GQ44DRAFT_606427 [Phaeosphaeriaceae sp. PMI808]|nr:hypothetical protein GQ44DRAFT_606427 [Phaeosphaeriaceae sp. PMI808]
MSSSPTIPSPALQATRTHKQLGHSDQYHQTVYDDGRSRYIVECRRQSKPGHGIAEETPKDNDPSPAPSVKGKNSPEALLPAGLASRDSVIKRVSSKTRSAPIIITTPRGISLNNRKDTEAFQSWLEPTPPPTPHLIRLATPELSDLDEAPFCECDSMAAFVICCTSCKREAGPRCHRF